MIEVNNLSGISVGEEFFKKIARIVFRGERANLPLSVALVESRRIKKLNSKYRKKDRPTDVLSFRYDKGGEIVICPSEVKKNAKKFKSTFKKELKKVLIHGILHLFGYDHEKSGKEAQKMKERENRYFKLCQRII